MAAKPCSRCGAPAAFSLAFLLSTVGRTPRQQKCTASVPFCNACIQGLCEALGSAAPSALVQPLKNAHTAIGATSDEQSNIAREDQP